MHRTTTLRAAQHLLLAGSGLAASLTLAWGQPAQTQHPVDRGHIPTLADTPLLAAPTVVAMLAREWHDGLDPAPYLVSEKLDGVRALWDGTALRFRSGRAIAAPAWFIAALPKTPLDGELWIGYGQFDRVSGTVRRAAAVDADWRALRYLVFDLPTDPRPFAQRAAALAGLVHGAGLAWLQPVAQTRFADASALRRHLVATTARGGEGLMLHHQDALRQPGRSEHLFKLKVAPDAEARVLGYVPGKGKFAGRMGALLVQTPEGKRFSLGSGFTEAQRAAPPAIGSTVTYRYRDRTSQGLPRFASFVRMHAPD